MASGLGGMSRGFLEVSFGGGEGGGKDGGLMRSVCRRKGHFVFGLVAPPFFSPPLLGAVYPTPFVFVFVVSSQYTPFRKALGGSPDPHSQRREMQLRRPLFLLLGWKGICSLTDRQQAASCAIRSGGRAGGFGRLAMDRVVGLEQLREDPELGAASSSFQGSSREP